MPVLHYLVSCDIVLSSLFWFTRNQKGGCQESRVPRLDISQFFRESLASVLIVWSIDRAYLLVNKLEIHLSFELTYNSDVHLIQKWLLGTAKNVVKITFQSGPLMEIFKIFLLSKHFQRSNMCWIILTSHYFLQSFSQIF